MYHMRISGTEPSSVILSQNELISIIYKTTLKKNNNIDCNGKTFFVCNMYVRCVW